MPLEQRATLAVASAARLLWGGVRLQQPQVPLASPPESCLWQGAKRCSWLVFNEAGRAQDIPGIQFCVLDEQPLARDLASGHLLDRQRFEPFVADSVELHKRAVGQLLCVGRPL